MEITAVDSVDTEVGIDLTLEDDLEGLDEGGLFATTTVSVAEFLGLRFRIRGDQVTVYGINYDGTGRDGAVDKVRVTATEIISLTGNNARVATLARDVESLGTYIDAITSVITESLI